MAKRAPIDQRPFTALDKGLAASVMNPTIAPPPLSEEKTPEQPVEPARAEVVIEPSQKTNPPSRSVASDFVPPRSEVKTKIAADHPASEKLSREKRVLLTMTEEREIERCVDRIAEGFGGTPVKLSHLVRASLAVMRHAEGEIIRRAQEAGELTRPANGDNIALAEFEHKLAKVLSQAFRDAPALR